ncbi:MAG: hypothetical protein O3A82_00095 [Verrucomicrobia bacterium]|nr:hypothetical protein [Verrucomicrobiota bacterium]
MSFLKEKITLPPTRREKDGRSGFALILCLALLSVVFLFVLSMMSLVSLELRQSQLREKTVLAKTHARFGLSVACGQLNKHLGPDQKISAAAALLEGSMAYPSELGGRKYWTGVWDTKDKTTPPVWLVSEEDADPFDSGSLPLDSKERVELVGATGGTSSDADEILVKKVGLDLISNTNPSSSRDPIGSPKSSGSYAYWVGDEGLKAKISMPRTEDALVSTGFGVSIIPGFEGFESKIPAQIRSRLLNEASVANATKAVNEDTLHARFHDVTVHGHGVLANVRGGGLRRDLTAGLQPESKNSEGELVLTGDEQIFGPVGGTEPSSAVGYIPREGFPELQGYEIDMGSRVGRLPFNPTSASPQNSRRVELRESTAEFYAIDFEDAGDFDWDVRIEAERMGDGNIRLSLYHPSYTCYAATVYNDRGQAVQGLINCNHKRDSSDRRVVTLQGGPGNSTENVTIDPGGPLWDQLRDYYNLRASGKAMSPRVQMEDKVGIHPVISRAQFFLYPTYEREPSGKFRIHSHILPAVVLWNPHNVDIAPSKYTVALWNREQNGFGDKYRIYYNDRNVCESNYFLWYPRKSGGPDGEILDQGRAKVDIKGKNPEAGYPNATWPYIDLENEIAIDLVGPCRNGKIWTILETVPGETYEVRFPYGINEDDRPKPYVRRGIVSWDGTDMATFEGNTELFTYGTPQDYVSFSAVATTDQTKLEFRSDTHTKADGGSGGSTCQGVVIGICTVKSSSGYPASVKVPTKYSGLMGKKIGFVIDNASGLKAGEALVFTPSAEGEYTGYSIGEAPGNVLSEGWHGGHTFWKPTDKTLDSDAKPTHGEVLLDQNDTYVALFKGAVDTDASLLPDGSTPNDPLVVLSMGRFLDEGLEPEQFQLLSRKSSDRYSSSELAGSVGRRFVMRYAAEEDQSSSGGRIRWLANYNPRASLLSPTPYEFSESAEHPLTGSLQTIPNYRTKKARVSDDEWEVPVSGSASHDSPFIAYSHQSGVTQGALFEIPKGYDHEHFRSLAQFSHVDFSTKTHRLIREYLTFDNSSFYEKYAMRGLGHKPSYAIGNSLADPRIPLDAPYTNLSDNIWTATESRLDAGYHYDHSYLLNEALWDSYFLSTVPRSVTSRQMEEVDFALANNRLKLRRNPRLLWRQARELVEAGLPAPQAYMAIRDRSDDDLKSYDLASSMLLLDGAFNVNSTSVHAWSALLGSFFGAKVKGKDGVQPGDEYESPFLRINEPLGSAIKDGDNVNSASEEAYLGYRSLSQSEIRDLATEIVVQVKQRGPFRSLAEFINRTLPEGASSASSDWESDALQGALAAAIESAGINEDFRVEMIEAKKNRNFDLELKATKKPGGSTAAAGPAASNAPGFLTQADLLSRLGPCLSVRSDTFRVRVYGEAMATLGANRDGDESHFRGEAIFQRLPDVVEQYEVPSKSSDSPDSPEKEDWNGLHRTFALIGFRWLRDNEI